MIWLFSGWSEKLNCKTNFGDAISPNSSEGLEVKMSGVLNSTALFTASLTVMDAVCQI